MTVEQTQGNLKNFMFAKNRFLLPLERSTLPFIKPLLTLIADLHVGFWGGVSQSSSGPTGAGRANLPAVVQQVRGEHRDVNVLPVHRVQQGHRAVETGG